MMKLYVYATATGNVEIEVEEEWVTVLEEYDRLERNNQQTETRRHCSLEALNLDEGLLPCDVNIEADFVKKEDYAKLYAAIEQLKPNYRCLIEEIYIKGRKLVDVAAEKGVHHTTITKTLKRALEHLRKNLKNF